MKYYTIEELFKNGGGQFLVMVESEDDVKKIIEEEKETYKGVDDFVEIRYIECTEKDYVRFVEQSIVIHSKTYFYKTLDIDGNLPVKEYNKIKYAPDNEAKAIMYYKRRVAAFDLLREKMDLSKVSAKEFLNAIEKLASSENGEAYQMALDEILNA